MGPAGGLVEKLDVDRLAGMLAQVDLELAPFRFRYVLAEFFLSIDQNHKLPIALGVIGDFQLEDGFLPRRHLDLPGQHAGNGCLLYTSPSPRDKRQSRMPSSA